MPAHDLPKGEIVESAGLPAYDGSAASRSRVTCGPCALKRNEVVVMRQVWGRVFECPDCGQRERVHPKGAA